MSLRMKLMAAFAAAAVTAALVSWIHSEAKLRRMERAVDAAEQQARASEETARTAELSAAGYREKIEHLEREIESIGLIARRQDEELDKIGVDVGGARRDVQRARGIGAIDAAAGELCAKLAALGHPC